MTKDQIDLIKKAVSAVDVCNMRGIRLNRAGFARCPFHSEKTASFKAYPGSRGFHCFGCGKSGDVIRLVMDLDNISFQAACERLNDDFKLGLPLGREISEQEKIMRNKASWERQKRERELDKKRQALVDEQNEAIEVEKAIRILLQYGAPDDPDGDWSEMFCEALKMKAEAFNRTDEAYEAIDKFDEMRYAAR